MKKLILITLIALTATTAHARGAGHGRYTWGSGAPVATRGQALPTYMALPKQLSERRALALELRQIHAANHGSAYAQAMQNRAALNAYRAQVLQGQ